MRTIHVEEVTRAVREMCIEANHFLSKDMKLALQNTAATEKEAPGREILKQLQENLW